VAGPGGGEAGAVGVDAVKGVRRSLAAQTSALPDVAARTATLVADSTTLQQPLLIARGVWAWAVGSARVRQAPAARKTGPPAVETPSNLFIYDVLINVNAPLPHAGKALP
jgi:hypothetical protein